jgi:endonuclease/exonuclease/phosphatase family metal-dependent hydrolase
MRRLKSIYYKSILLINSLVAIVLGMIYLSAYINPSKFWPAAILGLVYPYLLLANLFFVIFWLYKRRKYALISFVAIIVGWKYMSANFRISSKTKDTTDGISVMSFNIMMKDLSVAVDRNNNKNLILEYIQSQNTDFACIQEYHCPSNTDDLFPQTLVQHYDEQNSHIERNEKPFNYGLAIFSKWPLVSKGSIRFDNSANFIIFADFRVNRDTVRVYNAHLQSIRFRPHDFKMIDSLAVLKNSNRLKHASNISFKLKDAFQKRAMQVNKLMEHIRNSPYPVVVCGDFNDTPVSYTYKRLSSVLDDSFMQKGRGLGYTYTHKIPFRIDYIMHSEDLKTLWFERGYIKISDHYPVMARLSLKQGKNLPKRW